MPLTKDQQAHFMGRVKKLIDAHYGSDVPTLNRFKQIKKATYVKSMREELEADKFDARIAELDANLDGFSEVLKVYESNEHGEVVELKLAQTDEMDALKEKQRLVRETLSKKHGKQSDKFIAGWKRVKAPTTKAISSTSKTIGDSKRAMYFEALGIEDDDRQLYRRDYNDAINSRVGELMEYRLMETKEGQAVLKRIEEEGLAVDLAYAAKGIQHFWKGINHFIDQGLLPDIRDKMLVFQIYEEEMNG